MNGVADPVWARRLPWALDEMAKQAEALTTLFGEGLQFVQRGQHLVVFTAGDTDCWCRSCDDHWKHAIVMAGGNRMDPWMGACPGCGEQSCAKAQEHSHICSEAMKSLLAGAAAND